MLQVRCVDSDAAWAQARAIRQRVFVEEQQCPPEEEWDAHDEASRHFVGWVDGRAVATARWRPVAYERQPAAKLERFAVLPSHRGQGYGRRLVASVMQDAVQAGYPILVLHAQAHLEAFYASFGFQTVSARFMEAGIPHVKMIKRTEEAPTDPGG